MSASCNKGGSGKTPASWTHYFESFPKLYGCFSKTFVYQIVTQSGKGEDYAYTFFDANTKTRKTLVYIPFA